MLPKTTLWALEPHTKGKHLVLDAYLKAWLPILGKWNGRILFIDGFAGPGEYQGGEIGSPLIALNAFKNHASKANISAEVVYFFIEDNAARAKHLESLVNKQKPLPTNCKTQVIEARFDETLTNVLDYLDQQRGTLAPAFVMIDPFGVSDTPMSVIRRILQNSKSEVYISVMYEAINRFKETPEFESHLDALFGTSDWRAGAAIEDPLQRKTFLFDLYKNQLRRSGAKYVVHFELYEGNRLVYAIFFGTQHSKGADVMKQAIWKVAPFGDFEFRGTHSTQLTLGIAAPDFGPLRNQLKTEFGGKGWVGIVGSSRVDLQACKLEYSIVSPK